MIAGAEVRAAAATTQKLGQWINDAMIDATKQTMKRGLEKAKARMNECERRETKCKTLGRCLSILLDEGVLDMIDVWIDAGLNEDAGYVRKDERADEARRTTAERQ